MAVAVMRGAAPEGCLAAALDPDRDFNVPIAPELGLFLVRRAARRGAAQRPKQAAHAPRGPALAAHARVARFRPCFSQRRARKLATPPSALAPAWRHSRTRPFLTPTTGATARCTAL